MTAPFRPEPILSPDDWAKRKRELEGVGFNMESEGGAGRDWTDTPITEQIKGGLGQAREAVTHPIQTVKGMVTSAVEDAKNTFTRPMVGRKLAYHGELGGYKPEAPTVTKENTPNAISGKEGAKATLNTTANLILPMLPFTGIATRAATNATLGAINDEEQPIRGATAGLFAGELIHQGGKAIGKGVARARRAPIKSPEEFAANPTRDLVAEVSAPAPDGPLAMLDDARKAEHQTELAALRTAQPRGPAEVARDFEAAERAHAPPDEAAPTGPERINAPAIRTKDGRIFEGPMHILAMEEAQKAGALPKSAPRDYGYEDGFTTSAGRFVGREEAFSIAEGVEQPNVNTRAARAAGSQLDAADIAKREKINPREVRAANRKAVFSDAKEAFSEFLDEHPVGLSTKDVSNDPNFRRAEPAGQTYKAPIDQGKDPRLANVSKFGFSPEGEQVWRGIVGKLDLRKKRIPEAEQMAEANRRATNPDALIRREGQWDGMDALASRMFQSQSAERIATLSRDLKTKTLTPEESGKIQGEIGRLTDDISILASRGAKERTAAGRNLSAYKIVAKHTMDEPTWQTLASRAKGELPLSSDEILKVRHLTSLRDREGLVQFVSSLHKSSTLDKWLTLWKAGLLTSPTTHLANTLGNTSMAILETAKEPLALGIDAVISLARGSERTKGVPVGGYVRSQIKAIGSGLREARKVFKTGVTPEDAAKWDFRKTNYDNAFFQSYTDVVFHSLAAEDRVFRSMAMARSLGEQVKVRVREMRRADPKLNVKAETAKLMQAPPDELMVQAIADAEIATFQNRGSLARVASGVKKGASENPSLRVAAELTLPFTQTPANVATRLVDYSPLGIVTAAMRQAKKETRGQKRLAEDLARSATGSSLVALGYLLAQKGLATGSSPTSPDERNQWELQGKLANSVLIDGRWYNISRLSPAGMLMALGAQFNRIVEQHGAKSPSKAVGGMLGAAGRVVTDQSFLRGVSGSLDAINDPVRYGGNFVDNLGASVVPSAVGRVAQMVDPVKREANGMLEGIQSRIPFASQKLPAKLNAFGQEQVRSPGERATTLVDFMGSRKAVDDAIVAELAKYQVTIGKAARSRTVRGERIEYTPDEQRAFLARIGPARRARIAQVIASPAYFKASDDSKQRRLRDAIEMEGDRVYAEDDRRRRREPGQRMADSP